MKTTKICQDNQLFSRDWNQADPKYELGTLTLDQPTQHTFQE
jgi:hypothetical protein